MPAPAALRADGHRDAHPAKFPGGSQHLLITLDEEKTGRRIGDAEVMIEVTDPHDLSGVGENLQDHLQLRTAFKVRNVLTLNQRVNSLLGKAMMGLEYAVFRSGPLSMAPSQLGGFTRSARSHANPSCPNVCPVLNSPTSAPFALIPRVKVPVVAPG